MLFVCAKKLMTDSPDHILTRRFNWLPARLRPPVIALAGGTLLAGMLAALSRGSFWNGWLAAGLLAFAAIYLLILAWRWAAGAGRMLGWMVAMAFLLRLLTGVGLSLALPVWGYPEPEQQAGYLFKDASARDTQAWELAGSGKPLWESFRSEFASDQYGGLLALSALVYRYLSPDAHRPFLILILGSFFAALGVPFLVAAARLRFTERIATLAGWIYVLYPEAIFYSSSQLREPFLVGLAATAFWAVLAWDWRRPRVWAALALSLIGMALISSRVAAAAGGFLGLLFQVWTHTIAWPVNIGGKSPLAWPAKIPITFESGILIGGIATFAAIWVACRLPRRNPVILDERLTDDKFGLVVPIREGMVEHEISNFLKEAGADEVRRVEA